MLIGAPEVEVLDVVVAVEDDAALSLGYSSQTLFRDNGLSTEMIATGSPRKRYDKAKKRPAVVVVGIRFDGKTAQVSTSGPGSELHERVKQLILELVSQ